LKYTANSSHFVTENITRNSATQNCSNPNPKFKS